MATIKWIVFVSFCLEFVYSSRCILGQNGTLNESTNFQVKKGEDQDISFFGDDSGSGPNLWKIQLDVSGDQSHFVDVSGDQSVYVSIRKSEQVKNFRLPHSFPDTDIKTTRRTIEVCPWTNEVEKNSSLLVRLSTNSPAKISLDLKVEISNLTEWSSTPGLGGSEATDTIDTWTSNATLKLGDPVVKFVPKFELARGDGGGLENLWRVDVASDDDSHCMCSVVSIQNATCPYYDRIESAKRYGQWQTMLNKSSMIINSSDYPNGFLIVVVASPDDSFCNIVKPEKKCNHTGIHLNQQNLSFTVRKNSSRNDYITGTLVIVGAYILLLIISLTISCLRFNYDVKFFKDIKELTSVIHEKMGKPLEAAKSHIALDSFITNGIVANENSYDRQPSCAIEPNSLVLTGTGPDCVDALGFRLNKTLYVTDLSQKMADPSKSKAIYQKNKLYAGNLLLMSVFYCVPIIQIVARSNAMIDSTGNHDLCYFNHLCQKPLGYLKDFSHVFSNIGYIMFGILFIGIVALKESKYLGLSERCRNNFGIPQQFGLFYTMGMALIMEGILSSCYHVCPTVIAFQYDTTYMYLMFMLIFLKFFQSRHPDISCNAIKAYFGLGVALILEAISIYYNGPIFWTIFCICYIVFIIIITTHAYHLGVIRMDHHIILNVLKLIYAEFVKLWKSVSCSRKQQMIIPKIRPRIIFLGVLSSLNIGICVYFGVNNATYASNYLLGIFACNMTVYLAYYVTMKIVNKECPNWEAWFYLACVVAMGIPALKLFKDIEKTTDVSPAESRSYNKDCRLFNFYDGHDIWHFLGGAAVFFGFMFLLTVDENLKYTRRDLITVF